MNKKDIITALLTLVAVAGQAWDAVMRPVPCPIKAKRTGMPINSKPIRMAVIFCTQKGEKSETMFRLSPSATFFFAFLRSF